MRRPRRKDQLCGADHSTPTPCDSSLPTRSPRRDCSWRTPPQVASVRSVGEATESGHAGEVNGNVVAAHDTGKHAELVVGYSLEQTWRPRPASAGPIAAATADAVGAALRRAGEALAGAVPGLAALDPARMRVLIGVIGRLLL